MRVAIVEDDARYRESLETLLGYSPDFEAAGSFASTEALERELERLAARGAGVPWDLVLVDLELPGRDGIAATRRLKEHTPSAHVVIVTVFEDPALIVEAISAGADGYLLKTASAREIAQAVHDALAGGSPMNPRIARRVLEMFSKFAPKQADYGLSDREKEILQLMVTGLIKKEIADRLNLSVHTVDTYLRRIYEKLEVNTRTGAVAKALKEGLV